MIFIRNNSNNNKTKKNDICFKLCNNWLFFILLLFFKHKNLYVNKIINFILLKLYIKIVAELKRIKLTFLYF